MAEPNPSKRVCRECGSANDADSEGCVSCGGDLNEDPELAHVDPDRRVELTRFETERGDEADLLCGLLRANGIACELSSTALPGLPADLIVWVNSEDARPALALMPSVKAKAKKTKPHDADGFLKQPAVGVNIQSGKRYGRQC